MPPQGESTGFAVEDAVLISRVFERFQQEDISRIFEVYENTRRARINTAYKEAVFRWGQVKDKSWFGQKANEWLAWAFLWFKKDAFEASMTYDIRMEKLIE
jgi:salicylate hydroxylase